MATRAELHQLVSSLPEHLLEAAYTVLTQMQARPPGVAYDREGALEHFCQAQQRVHDRMQERLREMVEQLARRRIAR